MEELSKNPKVLFLGQQVLSEDFYDTLTALPPHSRREMPVAEEMQLGISIGLALEGYLPVSIYQRMDFLPRAMDQFVNHLNLIESLSRGLYCPKIIIRTTVGTIKPLDTGLQHSKNLIDLMTVACNFPVLVPTTPKEVHHTYEIARTIASSILIVEKQELY